MNTPLHQNKKAGLFHAVGQDKKVSFRQLLPALGHRILIMIPLSVLPAGLYFPEGCRAGWFSG
ncbi:hypothetical protein Bcoa_1353 [Heyndrickxia coagulans 36D1]|uniref:Uncharacterized protein n=1 Tax=Heyndrickxia coagulans 36D1 TaxID=345219 RepID=G2TIT6_HEYCO|nr:hypothetical protein Bcoa_1353 [Heyndrickxia coagulans 36D1]